MYSTCLFCSASLGTNEAIEEFPVGRRVAFDAWKGRLWAVCSRCGRWNLAPLEERWEAVEAAERLFVDTRTRVHSENIGLARLPDGTRLVRVGEALPGELAAWRYGGQLISRRRRNLAVVGASVATGTALLVGTPFLLSAGVPVSLLSAGINFNALYQQRKQTMRVVHRMPAELSPSGRVLAIRRWHLYHAVLAQEDSGEFAIELPPITSQQEEVRFFRRTVTPGPSLRLSGEPARRLVARAMSDYNSGGAAEKDVNDALHAIEAAGGPELFASKAAASGVAIVRRAVATQQPRPSITLRHVIGTFRGEVMPIAKMSLDRRPRLAKTDALALEIALQEEAERRALEGELAALEAAWREAEEIAHIADALPDLRSDER